MRSFSPPLIAIDGAGDSVFSPGTGFRLSDCDCPNCGGHMDVAPWGFEGKWQWHCLDCGTRICQGEDEE